MRSVDIPINLQYEVLIRQRDIKKRLEIKNIANRSKKRLVTSATTSRMVTQICLNFCLSLLSNSQLCSVKAESQFVGRRMLLFLIQHSHHRKQSDKTAIILIQFWRHTRHSQIRRENHKLIKMVLISLHGTYA